MTTETPQTHIWSDTFGKEYTDRNTFTLEEIDTLYAHRLGISRSDMNQQFLGNLDRSLRILEVGSNIGLQLSFLQHLGFTDLWGVELQWYAVEQAKQRTHHINIIQGTVFDLPFRDGYFDLVYTSGVLIHISPDDLPQAMQEIYRCSSTYIWGCEYWAESCTEVPYRGHTSLLWKMDFARHYRELFDDLELVQEETYPWVTDEHLVDSMFLLKKRHMNKP